MHVLSQFSILICPVRKNCALLQDLDSIIKIIMKNSQTSYLAARATIGELDKSLWNRIAASSLKRIIPKHAGNFVKRMIQSNTSPSFIRGQSANTRRREEQPKQEQRLKEGMLSNCVTIQETLRVKSQEKSGSKPSTNHKRKRRDTQISTKYANMHQEQSTRSKSAFNKTISEIKIPQQQHHSPLFFENPQEQPQIDTLISELRNKKLFLEEKQQEHLQLIQLKQKAKVDRQNMFKRKLKEIKTVYFDYHGQIQKMGKIPDKILAPGVIVSPGQIQDCQKISNLQGIHKIKSVNIETNSQRIQKKHANERLANQAKINKEINNFLIKNQSHQRLFGHFFDDDNKITEGVSIFQVGTGLKRQRPQARTRERLTRNQFQKQNSLRNFRSHQYRIDFSKRKNIRIKTTPSEKISALKKQNEEQKVINEQKTQKNIKTDEMKSESQNGSILDRKIALKFKQQSNIRTDVVKVNEKSDLFLELIN